MIKFMLDIDPATLSTAQQKGMFHGRVFTNPKVARAMKTIQKHIEPFADKVRSTLDKELREADPHAGVKVRCIFRFAFPKSGTKKEKASWYEGMRVTSARYGDVENRYKHTGDSLVLAGAIPDDHFITLLTLRKVYTFKQPKIDFVLGVDEGCDLDGRAIVRTPKSTENAKADQK